MWLKFPSREETSQYIIQEAIQRESIVHLVKGELLMAKTPNLPSAEFQRLYLAFINLKTPIDSKKASSLMNLIMKHLSHPKTPEMGAFDEDANTVRLLLHLEEYHQESYLQSKALIKTQKVQEKILQSDISFQLSDSRLSSRVKRLLNELQNTKFINEQHIFTIFQILKQEKMSGPQLGRFFRALNLVFNGNKVMYQHFDHQLNEYPEIVSKLLKMLIKHEYRAAKKYRSSLVEALISKGVLSESDTAEDSENLRGSFKQPLLTSMLYVIFKKMSLYEVITCLDRKEMLTMGMSKGSKTYHLGKMYQLQDVILAFVTLIALRSKMVSIVLKLEKMMKHVINYIYMSTLNYRTVPSMLCNDEAEVLAWSKYAGNAVVLTRAEVT
ncbi:uncharacterized protein MELLADRAFT_109206 [Melampsora larici-populina 98AG31]|uniref:Uncharacterized protein n=1 Tax=Melampsora larici-populina (strain 98AG31 / pathotype 3-4-7) TaxID=747676 RepID=F4RVQ6_MELLP|nr:uncharacterized protein MELLADRAFT_109206 [Melampsora larici-populina 98AG31]EGG03401.1 hypothetical protein MELLADRAFT_109206 [Melampsora larici-populina 98AG31]